MPEPFQVDETALPLFSRVRGLNLGAVALLDVLGFKGIWQHHDAGKVLQQMARLRESGQSLRGARKTGSLLVDDGLRHEVKFISDTIVVAAMLSRKDIPERGIYRAMMSVVLIVGDIVRRAIEGSPALAFRGCLAAGLLRISGNFIIGPAVDEAAEWYECAEGAFFWLAPSAMCVNNRYETTYYNERINPWVMVPYDVPLKNEAQTTLAMHNFSMLGVNASLARWPGYTKRLLKTFDRGMGYTPKREAVERKKRNTAAFLAHVRNVIRSESWKKMEYIYRRPQLHELSPDARRMLLAKGLLSTREIFQASERVLPISPASAPRRRRPH
jgi:hypothetical protein